MNALPLWTVDAMQVAMRAEAKGALPQAITGISIDSRTLGPGEAYRDSRRAARVGRFRATVDELQTPYVFPQENGNRAGVRWLTLRDDTGAGLAVAGEPVIDVTARRWTSEALDAARHPVDLQPEERIWLNLDHAQNGLGSASCGPGVLPACQLPAIPTTFTVAFRLVG